MYRKISDNLFIMRSLKILTALLSSAAILCSCSEKMQINESGASASGPSAKLIYTSENAVTGSIIVRLDSDAATSLNHGIATRSGNSEAPLTRSGIEDLDSVLENIDVVSITPLFRIEGKNAERAQKAGLDRWFVIRFSKDVNLDEAAMELASADEVSGVQFNKKMQKTGGYKAVRVPAGSGMENFTKSSSAPFNDPMLGKQWHYINTGDRSIYSGIKAGADINCAAAWKLCTGDPRIIVAVVDDGVQWDHPDLAANMWKNEAELNGTQGKDDDGNGYIDDIYGYNFVTDGPLALSSGDEGSHGTHVAGTVAAVNNNGTGVCGVAGGSGNNDGVRIMSCQIFYNDDQRSGTSEVIVEAIRYAADNGASIIQCSFSYGGGACTSDAVYSWNASAEKAAIDYFMSVSNNDAVDGGLAIFAAGNDSSPVSAYPAAYKDYISVTAISCDFTPAYYTNHGPGSNIAAPGGDAYQSYLESDNSYSQILSTFNGGEYGYMQGTSMACPHVSGAAALGLSYALKLGKKYTRDQFTALLLTSVYGIDGYCTGEKPYYTDYGYPATLDLSQFKGTMGTGCIDAYQLLMNVRGTTCIPVETGKQEQIDIAQYIGDGNATFTISAVDISEEDKSALGISADPVIYSGKILLKCSKTGSGIIKVTLKAGTGNSSGMNGLPTAKEFALISRPFQTDNGGWL